MNEPFRPNFTLIVVASADGFIARYPGHSTLDWASPEEQTRFLARVDAMDWGFMGRTTHEEAFKEHRRRVIFSASTGAPAWRTPNHLWLDPDALPLADMLALAHARHPLREAAILGGTRVHDWFHKRGLIDRIELTVEPCRLESGLPVFGEQAEGDPEEAIRALGYATQESEVLNEAGTRLAVMVPGR